MARHRIDRFARPVPFRPPLVLAVTLAALWLAAGVPAGAQADPYAPLKTRLVKDGHSPEAVSRIYAHAPSPLFRTVAKASMMRDVT